MRAIELFAGAGGLGIGVSRAGFTPSAIVEWDRYCRDTIRENQSLGIEPISHWPTHIDGDVRHVDFKPFEGDVSLVSGGPPCQPFSLGGKHRAHDDHRDMFSEAVRVVREVQPKAFLFENVKGLTRSSFRNYFEYIILQMQYPELIRRVDEGWKAHLRHLERHHTGSRGPRGLEYNVVWNVLNSANHGIPQKRERVFFVGFRADLGVKWSFPAETHSQDALLWEQARSMDYWERHAVPKRLRRVSNRWLSRYSRLVEKPHQKPWRTVRDAISDLPDPEFEPSRARDFHNHVFQPGARSYPGHTGSPLDEPAKTLKAGVHGVPGGENMLLKPSGAVRYFSVRESARLQTFPDDFIFHGSWSETMRQLGNAVPVRLAEIVANSIASTLREQTSPDRNR